jgi:hypothetical protein
VRPISGAFMKNNKLSNLQEVDQADRILKDSVLVAERREGFCKVQLFQLPSSYIEVYRHIHFNVILKVNSFVDTVYLEPYLNAINLDHLF